MLPMKTPRTILATILCLGLTHCSVRQKEEPAARPALVTAPCPSLTTPAEASAVRASLDGSLSYFKRLSKDATVRYGEDTYQASQMIVSLTALIQQIEDSPTPESLSTYLQEHFTCYVPTTESILVTGYFESTLHGSHKKSARYKYPIYEVPSSLYKISLARFFDEPPKSLPTTLRARITPQNTVEPYFTREEIDFKDALKGEKNVIAWVDDPLALFFLHIQGSGVINTSKGEIRVNYADSNGHAYKPSGALLIREGKVTREEMSMQKITEYLKAHPEEQRRILSHNPSYVFFRKVDKGPLGSIQVPLTPMHSIATDSSLFPKGAPALLFTTITDPILGERSFSGIVCNQDTGGAIKGTGRVDLFTGRGAEAEFIAGHQKHPGSLYFLAPRIAQ
jgi:membrane-bound lytic murein transglycosylase A